MTNLYDKRDDLTFPIDNYSLINSNISAAPGNGVHISQLIHNLRACSRKKCFSGQISDAEVKATQTRLRLLCSKVEFMCTNKLRSSSRTS